MHEWYPSECAPVDAPVRILSGHITCREGTRIPIPAGAAVNNGWGAIGTTRIAGPVMKSLPESLQIRWFSFAENKFYGGDFQLDAAELDNLFDAGYASPLNGETKRFDRIIVGMCPGGGVAVWLKGEQIARELAFFEAEETQEDWNAFSDRSSKTRAEYVQSLLNQLMEPEQAAEALQSAQSGIARWKDSYRRKYDWAPRFLSRGHIRQMMLRYWSGAVLLDDATHTSREHSLPQQIDVYWANPDGVNYGASIEFEFGELSAAFQQLSSGGGPLRLDIEADTLAAEVTVFIANAAEVYRFREAAVRVFQM